MSKLISGFYGFYPVDYHNENVINFTITAGRHFNGREAQTYWELPDEFNRCMIGMSKKYVRDYYYVIEKHKVKEGKEPRFHLHGQLRILNQHPELRLKTMKALYSRIERDIGRECSFKWNRLSLPQDSEHDRQQYPTYWDYCMKEADRVFYCQRVEGPNGRWQMDVTEHIFDKPFFKAYSTVKEEYTQSGRKIGPVAPEVEIKEYEYRGGVLSLKDERQPKTIMDYLYPPGTANEF